MTSKVRPEVARQLILSIPHNTCANAVDDHWRVTSDGKIRPQSALWLFCWAKTGMNSEPARQIATQVFDEIIPIDFATFGTRVSHQYARESRYTTRDIDRELADLLARPANEVE